MAKVPDKTALITGINRDRTVPTGIAPFSRRNIVHGIKAAVVVVQYRPHRRSVSGTLTIPTNAFILHYW